MHSFSFGFREGHQASELTFTVRQLIEKCNEWRMPLFILKVDLAKAFDRLSHRAVWNTLVSSVPLHVAGAIMEQILDTSMQANLQGVLAPLVELQRGVRQGDPLSPTIFGSAMDDRLSSLRQQWIGRRVGFFMKYEDGLYDVGLALNGASLQPRPVMHGDRRTGRYYLPLLGFADDTYLLSRSMPELQLMAREFSKAVGEDGLGLQPAKCSWTTNVSAHASRGLSLTVEGLEVPRLSRDEPFSVLGTMVTMDGKSSQNTEARLQSAWRAFFAIKGLMSRDSLSQSRILSILLCRVQSSAIYHLHLGHLVKTDMRRVRSCQVAMTAAILCPGRRPGESHVDSFRRKRRRAAEIITAHSEQSPFWHQAVVLQRLRWAGHVARMRDYLGEPRVAYCAMRWRDQQWWRERQQLIRNGAQGLRHPGQFNALSRWESTACAWHAWFTTNVNELLPEPVQGTVEGVSIWHQLAMNRRVWEDLTEQYVRDCIPAFLLKNF